MQAFGVEGFENGFCDKRMVNVSVSRTITVLVIDDNRDFANILCRSLNYLGFMAKAAYGETSGLEKIMSYMPDLVFCDIGLPGKGGYTLADKIRSDHSFDHTLLVALTYFHKESKRSCALEHGYDAYISLPIRASHLDNIYEQVEARQLKYGRLELVNAG